MKKTIPNKLNHKAQAHAKLNKEKEEKTNSCLLKFFVETPTVKGYTCKKTDAAECGVLTCK